MRIVHTYRQHPGTGGSDIYFDELSVEMKKKQYCVSIITSDLKSWGQHFNFYTTPKKRKENLKIKRIPFTFLRFINSRFSYSKKYKKMVFWDKIILKIEKLIIRGLRFYFSKFKLPILWGLFQDELGWKLFLALIKERFDLIHTTCIPRSCITASLLAAKIKKVPVMITPFYHYKEKRFYENDKFWIKILRKFDCINVCTNAERNYFIKHGIDNKKIVKIGLGVYFDQIRIDKDNLWRDKLQIDKDNFVVLYMNSIISDHHKGVHEVIEAAARLPSIDFIFAGYNEEIWNKMMSNYHKKYRLNNCHFVGYVVGKAKHSLFHASDLVVRPSINEALGIFYLEGMSAGKPIITSNIEAMKEMSKDVGISVEYGNYIELINAIKTLQSNKELYQIYSRNAIEKSINYSWNIISGKFKRTYEILLNLYK